jgi:hypothetical protein
MSDNIKKFNAKKFLQKNRQNIVGKSNAYFPDMLDSKTPPTKSITPTYRENI